MDNYFHLFLSDSKLVTLGFQILAASPYFFLLNDVSFVKALKFFVT